MNPPIILKNIACVLLLLLLMSPFRGHAQVITGAVVDASSNEGVEAVELVLLSSAGTVARVGITGPDGGFTIEAEHTGRYQLRTSRIGYEALTSDPFDLLAGDTMRVELRIGVSAVDIAPLRVVSERERLVLDQRLERYGFYERQDLYGTKSGFAEFFDYEEIRARTAFDVSDLLRMSRRVRIIPIGGREVVVRGPRRCRPTYLLDGVPVRLLGESINDLVNAAEIIAMEVYMGGVGPWGNCVVALWTGYHDAMSGGAR